MIAPQSVPELTCLNDRSQTGSVMFSGRFISTSA